MRVIVAGSRNFTDTEFLEMILDDLFPVHTAADKVVQGFAIGADRMAYYWAKNKKMNTDTFLPDWRTHGKAAGFIRNKEMVDKGADLCLIFYGRGGVTAGTWNTEELARKAGIPVRVYYEQD